MPAFPGGIPGFEITLHINTVCIPCWLAMPCNLYILKLVKGIRVLFSMQL